MTLISCADESYYKKHNFKTKTNASQCLQHSSKTHKATVCGISYVKLVKNCTSQVVFLPSGERHCLFLLYCRGNLAKATWIPSDQIVELQSPAVSIVSHQMHQTHSLCDKCV